MSGQINPLIGTLKPQAQSNGPIYSNTVIGTLMGGLIHLVPGTSKRSLGKLRPHHSPYTKFNSAPINGQCPNFILFDVTL